MNTMDLEGKKLLIRPEVAEYANKANVIVGEPRKDKEDNKVLGRQVVLGKQPDGKEVIKITIKNPTLGVHRKCKKILVLNLSSPRVQKLASGRRMKLKCSASGSSQLLICCCPNMLTSRPVLVSIDRLI